MIPDKISRNGALSIKFSHPMIVPKFLDNATNKRELGQGVYLSEIDLTRDIIDLKFELKSEIKASKI
jgi:hypothetical protein